VPATSPAGTDGFPGNFELTIQYSLAKSGLVIRYGATTDAPTVCNMTNHSYFNLNGHASGSALGHRVTVDADFYLEADAASIPTGRKLPVKGTPMDFTEEKTLGLDIGADFTPLTDCCGYDQCYVIRDSGLRHAAWAVGPETGIRMEVTAAYIHENTAEIYLSLEDLTGTSFDETVDLFDSYRLHTPFDCTGHCQLASYDPDTHTATFLVTLEQWDRQSIEGEKLTFSVQKLLSGKKTWEGTLDGVDLGGSLTSATQTVQPRGLSGDLLGSDGGKSVTVLKPGDAIASPVDGVTLTGIGYVDGRLHVQVYYADIPKTDNHGSISLVNRETGEQIECDGSAAFFDDAGTGSYEDYVFTGIEADALDTYALYGMFVTSAGPVEGNWSVTFSLENTAGN